MLSSPEIKSRLQEIGVFDTLRQILDQIYAKYSWPNGAFPAEDGTLRSEDDALVLANKRLIFEIFVLLKTVLKAKLEQFVGPREAWIPATKRVLKAVSEVPRHLFAPSFYADMRLTALHQPIYSDTARSIGFGQTLSQPSLVVFVETILNLKGHEKVLSIGAGRGWAECLLAKLAKEVYATEIVEPLRQQAEANARRMRLSNLHILPANLNKLGYPEAGPYDAIVVWAESPAPEVPPDLEDQLVENGKLVIPLFAPDLTEKYKKRLSLFKLFIKKDGKLVDQGVLTPAQFVPLILPPARSEVRGQEKMIAIEGAWWRQHVHSAEAPNILAAEPFDPQAVERLLGYPVNVNSLDPDSEPLSRDQLLAAVRQGRYSFFLGFVNQQYNEEFFQTAYERLKEANLLDKPRGLIVMSAGTDNIDKAAAEKYGFQVSNAPGILTQSMAELNITSLLEGHYRTRDSLADISASDQVHPGSILENVIQAKGTEVDYEAVAQLLLAKLMMVVSRLKDKEAYARSGLWKNTAVGPRAPSHQILGFDEVIQVKKTVGIIGDGPIATALVRYLNALGVCGLVTTSTQVQKYAAADSPEPHKFQSVERVAESLEGVGELLTKSDYVIRIPGCRLLIEQPEAFPGKTIVDPMRIQVAPKAGPDLVCRPLRDKDFGIVGLGFIGEKVARIAIAFGMNLVIHEKSSQTERYQKKKMDLDRLYRAYGDRGKEVRYVTLEELFNQAYAVTLLPSASREEGTDMINRSHFNRAVKAGDRLKIFINTGRGFLVNEEALYDWSNQDSRGRFAVLDVLKNETDHPERSPLFGLPNAMILGHTGSKEENTRRKMAMVMLDNLRQVLRGERPQAALNEAWQEWQSTWLSEEVELGHLRDQLTLAVAILGHGGPFNLADIQLVLNVKLAMFVQNRMIPEHLTVQRARLDQLIDGPGGFIQYFIPEAKKFGRVDISTISRERLLSFVEEYREWLNQIQQVIIHIYSAIYKMPAVDSEAAMNKNELLEFLDRDAFNFEALKIFLEPEFTRKGSVDLSAWLQARKWETKSMSFNVMVLPAEEKLPRAIIHPELMHLAIERILENGFRAIASARDNQGLPARLQYVTIRLREVADISGGKVQLIIRNAGKISAHHLESVAPGKKIRLFAVNYARPKFTSGGIGAPFAFEAIRKMGGTIEVRVIDEDPWGYTETMITLPVQPRAEVRRHIRMPFRRSEVREDTKRLRRLGQRYVNRLSEAEGLSGNLPDIFVLLGNPWPKTFIEFAGKWKEIFRDQGRGIPIVITGGRGRGTRPLIQRTLEYYGNALDAPSRRLLERGLAAEDVTEADVIELILKREIKELSPDLVRKELVPSHTTAENFQSGKMQVEEIVTQRGLHHPTIALVTAPPLLLRILPTANKLWEGNIQSEGWQIKRFRTYDVNLDELPEDELIEIIGYLAGYPEKYITHYPDLNRYSEFRGTQAQFNPNVKTVPLTEEDWHLLAEVQKEFEALLDRRDLRYDSNFFRLVPVRHEAWADYPMDALKLSSDRIEVILVLMKEDSASKKGIEQSLNPDDLPGGVKSIERFQNPGEVEAYFRGLLSTPKAKTKSPFKGKFLLIDQASLADQGEGIVDLLRRQLDIEARMPIVIIGSLAVRNAPEWFGNYSNLAWYPSVYSFAAFTDDLQALITRKTLGNKLSGVRGIQNQAKPRRDQDINFGRGLSEPQAPTPVLSPTSTHNALPVKADLQSQFKELSRYEETGQWVQLKIRTFSKGFETMGMIKARIDSLRLDATGIHLLFNFILPANKELGSLEIAKLIGPREISVSDSLSPCKFVGDSINRPAQRSEMRPPKVGGRGMVDGGRSSVRTSNLTTNSLRPSIFSLPALSRRAEVRIEEFMFALFAGGAVFTVGLQLYLYLMWKQIRAVPESLEALRMKHRLLKRIPLFGIRQEKGDRAEVRMTDPLNPKTKGLPSGVRGLVDQKILESREVIRELAEKLRREGKKQKIGITFAMYEEAERIQKPEHHSKGEDFLRIKLAQLDDLLAHYSDVLNYQLVIVDDGDPEKTGEIAEKILRDEYPDLYRTGKVQVRFLAKDKGEEYANASRKGGAIEHGMRWLLGEGADYVIYTDADISTDLRQIGLLLRSLTDRPTAIAVGSRRLPQSVTLGRTFKARLSSFTYNQVVRFLLDIGDIRDSQAGFKAFGREAASAILNEVKDIRFSFDTELLALGRFYKFPITEVPIAWLESKKTTVRLSDVFDMVHGVWRQSVRLRNLKRAGGPRSEIRTVNLTELGTNSPEGYALELLKEGFRDFTIDQCEKLSGQVQKIEGQEVGALMINPLTGEMVHSFLWKQARKQESFFAAAHRLRSVSATLYERIGVSERKNLWFDERYVPIVGDDIYHANGTPFTEEELLKAGLRKARKPDGSTVKIQMLVTGNRVLALPGPWIIPFIKEGNGIRILKTLDDIQQITSEMVTFENLPEVLIQLRQKGALHLRTAAVLEFKGIGAVDFQVRDDAPDPVRNLRKQPVYMPAGDFRKLTKRDDPISGGVGAISKEVAAAVENDRRLRLENAELVADTVAALPLMNSGTVPELANTPWKETWYSVRLSYNTERLRAFTYSWSDSPPTAQSELAKVFYSELFGIQDEEILRRVVVPYLLTNWARNIRAEWVTGLNRTWSSDTVENYGPLMELIDTGRDSLRSLKLDQEHYHFFPEWRNYPYYFLQAVLSALAPAGQDAYNIINELIRSSLLSSAFLKPLLLDEGRIEEARQEFLNINSGRGFRVGDFFDLAAKYLRTVSPGRSEMRRTELPKRPGELVAYVRRMIRADFQELSEIIQANPQLRPFVSSLDVKDPNQIHMIKIALIRGSAQYARQMGWHHLAVTILDQEPILQKREVLRQLELRRGEVAQMVMNYVLLKNLSFHDILTAVDDLIGRYRAFYGFGAEWIFKALDFAGDLESWWVSLQTEILKSGNWESIRPASLLKNDLIMSGGKNKIYLVVENNGQGQVILKPSFIEEGQRTILHYQTMLDPVHGWKKVVFTPRSEVRTETENFLYEQAKAVQQSAYPWIAAASQDAILSFLGLAQADSSELRRDIRNLFFSASSGPLKLYASKISIGGFEYVWLGRDSAQEHRMDETFYLNGQDVGHGRASVMGDVIYLAMKKDEQTANGHMSTFFMMRQGVLKDVFRSSHPQRMVLPNYQISSPAAFFFYIRKGYLPEDAAARERVISRFLMPWLASGKTYKIERFEESFGMDFPSFRDACGDFILELQRPHGISIEIAGKDSWRKTLRSLQAPAARSEMRGKSKDPVSLSPSPISLEDLDSILENERVPVLRVEMGDLAMGFLCANFEKDSDVVRRYLRKVFTNTLSPEDVKEWEGIDTVLGRTLSRNQLANYATDIGVSFEALCQKLGVSPDSARFIVVRSVDEAMYRSILFEKTLHVLENIPSSVHNEQMEKIDDFIQILFYESSQASHFRSAYTHWSPDDIRALQEKYRDIPGIDPNTHLLEILKKLQDDFIRNIKITVSGKEVPLVELFYRGYLSSTVPPEVVSTFFEQAGPVLNQALIHYLNELFENEKFSNYLTLFPGWRLPNRFEEKLMRLKESVQSGEAAVVRQIVADFNTQSDVQAWILPASEGLMKGIHFTSRGKEFVEAIAAKINALALKVGFDLRAGYASDFSLVASELIANVFKYAEGGVLIAHETQGHRGLEIISVDRGQGVENVEALSQGKFEKKGSLGTSLALIQSKSTEVKFDSEIGKGSMVRVKLYSAIFEGRRVVAYADAIWSGSITLEPPQDHIFRSEARESNDLRGRSVAGMSPKEAVDDIRSILKIRKNIRNLKGRYTVVMEMSDYASLTWQQRLEYEKVLRQNKNIALVVYRRDAKVSRKILRQLDSLEMELGYSRVMLTPETVGAVFRKYGGLGRKLIHLSKKQYGRTFGELLRRVPIKKGFYFFRYLGKETGLLTAALLLVESSDRGIEGKIVDLSMISEKLRDEIQQYLSSFAFARAA
ncbi:MAG: glycosyltransferase [Candidatus Omnitrophica bacterium]|nr:glycosyltransferase [Candidatus Omnitrophota bacterium]